MQDQQRNVRFESVWLLTLLVLRGETVSTQNLLLYLKNHLYKSLHHPQIVLARRPQSRGIFNWFYTWVLKQRDGYGKPFVRADEPKEIWPHPYGLKYPDIVCHTWYTFKNKFHDSLCKTARKSVLLQKSKFVFTDGVGGISLTGETIPKTIKTITREPFVWICTIMSPPVIFVDTRSHFICLMLSLTKRSICEGTQTERCVYCIDHKTPWKKTEFQGKLIRESW